MIGAAAYVSTYMSLNTVLLYPYTYESHNFPVKEVIDMDIIAMYYLCELEEGCNIYVCIVGAHGYTL